MRRATLTVDDLADAMGSVDPATIWRWLRTRPGFPRPVKLGSRTTRWFEDEVNAYIAGLAAERKGAA